MVDQSMTSDNGDAGANVNGGCMCGDVRYECAPEPMAKGYCHCSMCQKALGAPFGAAINYERDGVRFVSGSPLWYHSSDGARRGFCGRCGSPLAYQRLDSGAWGIWIGGLDEPDRFKPEQHWWTQTKLVWGDVHPDLPDATDTLQSHKSTAKDG